MSASVPVHLPDSSVLPVAVPTTRQISGLHAPQMAPEQHLLEPTQAQAGFLAVSCLVA